MRTSRSTILPSRAGCPLIGNVTTGLLKRNLGTLLVLCLLLSIPASPAHGGFRYVEVTSEVGISGYTMDTGQGGSVSAADFDDDGDIDLFVPTAAGIPNRLYRNDGGTFVEIAEEAGLASLEKSRASLWLDYDGDHRLDLIVGGDCSSMPDFFARTPVPCADTIALHLYKQVDNFKFVDVTAEAGITTGFALNSLCHRGGISAGDINNDGYLDIIFAMWMGESRLLLNNGDGTFTDINRSAGIDEPGLALPRAYWQHMFHDFNGDGWQDIFTAQDFDPDRLWINQQDNTFVDVARDLDVDSAWNEMGVTLGDYDNDGDFDIYITEIEQISRGGTFMHNLLYNNQSVGANLQFEEVSEAAGVALTSPDWEPGATFAVEYFQWGWGCTFLDGDNDGLLDLAVTNGFAVPLMTDFAPWAATDKSAFLHNEGGDPPVFSNISHEVGFDDTLFGVSLVAFDYDRDGRLDLVQTIQTTEEHNGEISRLRLLRNVPDDQEPIQNYLIVKPRMAGPNHRAIGAVVRVRTGELIQSRLITAGNSFMGQEPAEAHFGLGSADRADSIIIEWPDGEITEFKGLTCNQIITANKTRAVGSLETVRAVGSDGGGGGGCLIATAAYGTPIAEEINSLRAVRDTYMLNNVIGTTFIDTYYRLSPPIAGTISESPGLRAIMRVALAPIVLICRLLLVAPLATCLLSAILVILASSLTLTRLNRRLKKARL